MTRDEYDWTAQGDPDEAARERPAGDRPGLPEEPAGSRKSVAKIERARRDAECIRLRSEGWSTRQIAARLGVDQSTVVRSIARALDKVPVEDVQHLRQIELQRLDSWERTLLEVVADPPFIVAPNGTMTEQRDRKVAVSAVDVLVRLSARRSRLLAMDLPPRRRLGLDELARMEMGQRLLAELRQQAETITSVEELPRGET